MRTKHGMTFADVLILIAIILLLALLAVPMFHKSRELSREEITGVTAAGTVEAATNTGNAAIQPGARNAAAKTP